MYYIIRRKQNQRTEKWLMRDKRDKLKVGVIGAGMIGDIYMDRIRRDGRGEVTWIASKTERTLSKKLKQFKIPHGSLDYLDMLRDSQLDAVIIATPPFLHAAMLKDALAAGKHVLLEKPMGVSPNQIEEMVNVVHRYPDQCVVECSCRHARLQPKFTLISTLIRDGAIGEVYHIHHNALTRRTFIEYNPAGDWAHQRRLAGGGAFIDWGVYDLSFHLGLLQDEPVIQRVRSFKRRGLKQYAPGFSSDIEEHGAAWLEFDTGLTYYYERGSGVQAEIPNETRLFGTKGSLRFAYCSWEKPEVEYYSVQNGSERHKILRAEIPGDHDDNLELVKHFFDVVIDGADPRMTVDLAAKHLDILMRILD
jgi:myo-inositol 2-dehydrogenase/D-chiro-inositol 1-dehydrogenase